MSDPKPAPVLPAWLSRAVVALLVVQVGLLWTHGSLLQRQHDDILALREDVQALADSLDQDQDWDSNEADPSPHPARWAEHHGGRKARAVLVRTATEDEPDPALKEAKKDLDATRKSQQDAIAKARDTQEKMSITANIEKAEAKARLETESESWQRWIWLGAAVAVAGLVVRAVLRRRGCDVTARIPDGGSPV